MKNEEELKQEVLNRLKWDDRVDESQIEVLVDKNIVTLKGCVSTYPEKILTEIETQLIPEVKEVVNQIEIKFPESYKKVEDKEVEEAMFCLFDANSEINSNDINISVKNGKVLLQGKVNSYWKKDKIRHMVSEIKGVLSVLDQILVLPDKKVRDEELKGTLYTSMENSIHVDVSKVKIEVDDGIVKLSGILPSMASYNAVVNIVKSTVGVIDIEDNLKWVLRYRTT